MLFNSAEFIIFLPIVFVLYWFVFNKQLKVQNFLILVSSYIFYGWWDYRFLALIVLSTLIDYIVALRLSNTQEARNRKFWLFVSIVFNVGVLVFFKYYNFFLDSWIAAFENIGYHLDPWTLSVILPVGISFYTFQTMSYTIDVYRNKLAPTRDFIAFGAFVSFFPQLVAGPIERASNLLPQFLKKRKFDYRFAVSGSRLILLGLVKKIVIADSLAPGVNEIFSNYENYSSGTLILGAVYFAFQIYCDFSGYSDIARGVARLFGFDLMLNFNFPYFAQSIGEFWRRWHISLSTWFRDYLYIPLGGSRVGRFRGILNVFIIFIVSGLWHGANWTFVTWGGIHALLFIPSFVAGTNRKSYPKTLGGLNLLPSFYTLCNLIFTFSLVTFAWVFFRAEDLTHALGYIRHSFTLDLIPEKRWYLYFYIVPFVLLEILYLNKVFHRIKFRFLRFAIYVFFVLLVIRYSVLNGSADFIYFQF